MFRFFRNIRRRILQQDSGIKKIQKYLLYSLGEIVLVVVGIFIALWISNYYEEKKENYLRELYRLSLVNDLKKDLNQLKENRVAVVKEEKKLKLLMDRMYNKDANLDTVIHIARNIFSFGYSISNSYNSKTFDALIATGKIDLFDKAIIESLIELNQIQLIQNSVFQTNKDVYFNRLNSFTENYETNADNKENSPIQKALWSNIDGKVFIPKFLAIVRHKKWGNHRFVQLTDSVISKTKIVITQLEDLNK